MFSGIIKSVGKIESITENGSTKKLIVSSSISDSLHVDQSVAHDGVCLTVVDVENGQHHVEVVMETLSKTTLGLVTEGYLINLETSITPETQLDGHMVQGHVDAALRCLHITDRNGSWKMDFELPSAFASLIIPQGSVCINGVSLTVSQVQDDSFSVSIIPYTFEHTNFNRLKSGDMVNVEFDLIGKYIIRQMGLRSISE